MNSKYYYKTNNHNIYSNNEYINSTKRITDLMENRFKESFDINNNINSNKNNLIVNNIYRRIKNNNSMIRKEKPFSKQLITNDNIEFFTLDDIDNKDLNKNNKSTYKIDDLHNDNIGDPNKDLLDYQFSDLKFEGPQYPIGGNDNIMKLFDIRNKRTYGVIPENELTHNNMVPYFKTKGNFGNSVDDEKHMSDLFNRKLELFTGSANNLDYKPKTERRPLFAPVPGLNNVYGAPVKTDFYEGRFIPGKERRNEKPFQEVRDTPGLNLGYNQVGIQGFHDPYRALPKTVNELRTLDNPKLTYNNPMGGIKKKNYKKKNIYSLQPLPYSKNNIEEFEEVNNNNEVMEEYETSGIGGFYAPGGGIRPVDPVVVKRRPDKFKDYHYDRHIPVSTEWHKHSNYGKYDQRTLGGVNRGLEDHTHPGTTTLLTNGQVIDGEHQTTHKEQYNHDGPSNVFTKIANYVINYFNSTPEPTKRNQYNIDDKGNIKGYNESYVINYKDNTPEPTKRNMYNIDDKGNITGYNESYVINYKDNTPEPTKRNQYNIDDKGNIKGYNESYVINYLNATPEATRRNQYNIDDKGNITGYDESYVINYKNATPEPTRRNQYNIDDKGNISGYDESYVINYLNSTPEPTKKDIHKVESYTGGINGYKQQRSRMDTNNMRTNIVKDLNTIVPHGPTYSNYTKTPSMEGTILTSNYNKLQINRELYPDIDQKVAGMDYPTVRSKVLVPNDEYHFNSFVNENLQGNPFVNDTQNVYSGKINYMENTTKNNLDYIPKYQQYN